MTVRRAISILACFATVLSLLGLAHAETKDNGPCANQLCAGSARADITPPVTTPMWGYNARWFLNGGQSPSQENPTGTPPTRWLRQHTQGVDTDLYQKGYFLRSEGIQTRLYARALAIRNAKGIELVLVQVDLGAMTGEMWRGVAQRIAPLGISRDHLLISATHTHGGPGAIQQPLGHALLVGDNYDPRVVRLTINGIVKAITLAHSRLAPARIAIGQTRMLGVSANRSFEPHLADPCPDSAAINDGSSCDQTNALGAHAIDPLLTMIRVDRINGLPLGVWTSFAIHGTVGGGDNLLFSGDNQGFAERLIEQGISDRAEARGIRVPHDWQIIDADANGSEGDIAPFVAPCDDPGTFDPKGELRPYACFSDFAQMEWNGIHQASTTLDLYDQLGTQMVSDLALDSRLDVLYMAGEDGTSPLAVFGSGNSCNRYAYGSPGHPNPPFDATPFHQDPFYGGAIPGQGRKCPLLVLTGTGPQYFWLQTMRIGDYVLANMPGEMTVEMARRVRKRIIDSPSNRDAAGSPIATHAIVVGLANDYMSYVTTPEEYDYQWYEGTFTLWGPAEGRLMTDRFGALSDAMLQGKPGPAFIEPPDTSGTQADNVSPLTQAASAIPPDKPVGTILTSPAATVSRGNVATFAWVGGQPSAEVSPDETFVAIQRLAQGDKWETVVTDGGYSTLVDYERDGLADHWDTRWDIPLNAPGGIYRFVVSGHAYIDGSVQPYGMASPSFAVSPANSITVSSATITSPGVVVRARYPVPDPKSNFRLRDGTPTTGTVTATVSHANGVSEIVSGTYDIAAGGYLLKVTAAPGDSITVLAGGLADGYGNTNGSAFTQTF